jgi:hypothetical protein
MTSKPNRLKKSSENYFKVLTAIHELLRARQDIQSLDEIGKIISHQGFKYSKHVVQKWLLETGAIERISTGYIWNVRVPVTAKLAARASQVVFDYNQTKKSLAELSQSALSRPSPKKEVVKVCPNTLSAARVKVSLTCPNGDVASVEATLGSNRETIHLTGDSPGLKVSVTLID